MRRVAPANKMITSAKTEASIRTLACLLLVSSCERDRPKPSDEADTVSRAAVPDTAPARRVSQSAHRPEELVTAATEIVGFLRGQIPFDRLRLADTVTLQLSREGGGTPRRIARERLRNRRSWTVRSSDLPHAPGMMYSFVPHERLTVLTTRAGRHLKCREYNLSSVAPELAGLPHVGTTLSPPAAEYESCLNTWNVTFVFDSVAKPPTLVAAVYDQWEW